MLMTFYQARKRAGGFTLIELMIVVAIVGILAAIAVPNFIAYRNKSRIAASVGSIESVRAAIAAYAADSPGNTFPGAADISSYATLQTLVNDNGANLKPLPGDQGFDLRVGGYTPIDGDGDGIIEDYTMSFVVAGVPGVNTGSLVLVSPSGIEKAKLSP